MPNALRCSKCEAFSDPDDHHAGPCDWMYPDCLECPTCGGTGISLTQGTACICTCHRRFK